MARGGCMMDRMTLGKITIYNRHGDNVETQREAELHITGSDWTVEED